MRIWIPAPRSEGSRAAVEMHTPNHSRDYSRAGPRPHYPSLVHRCSRLFSEWFTVQLEGYKRVSPSAASVRLPWLTDPFRPPLRRICARSDECTRTPLRDCRIRLDLSARRSQCACGTPHSSGVGTELQDSVHMGSVRNGAHGEVRNGKPVGVSGKDGVCMAIARWVLPTAEVTTCNTQLPHAQVLEREPWYAGCDLGRVHRRPLRNVHRPSAADRPRSAAVPGAAT